MPTRLTAARWGGIGQTSCRLLAHTDAGTVGNTSAEIELADK